MPATFEEILAAPAKSKCKTCNFIAALDEPLKSQVVVAVGKATYSDERIAKGFTYIETELNPAPRETAIRRHRDAGHA